MPKEKPANKVSGQEQQSEPSSDNLPQQRRGKKVGFSSADCYDPVRETMAHIERYLLEGGRPEGCFTKRTDHGLVIGLDDRREMIHPISSDRTGGDVDGKLSPLMVGQYCFDHLAEPEPENQIFEGLIAWEDLAIWLGREKHRKSNLLLQFAISAALGRDFLQFKFVARRPMKVVLIDFESKTASLWKRIRSILAAMELDEDTLGILWRNLRIVELRRVVRSGMLVPKFPVRAGRGGKMTLEELQESAEFWEGVAAQLPADLYVIDPLRPLHSADENDSNIESLLAELRRVFRNAAVVVAHHMRKPQDNSATLVSDMRAFSDGARGSSAIKAHADVIILQERTNDGLGEEVVYLGAFLKDGPDIEPFTLMESDHESFFWGVMPRIPPGYDASFQLLKKAGGVFQNKTKAAQVLFDDVSRATAFRQINTFLRIGILMSRDGRLVLNDTPKTPVS